MCKACPLIGGTAGNWRFQQPQQRLPYPKFSIQGAGVCFSIQVCPTRVVREIGNSLGWMLDLHRFANETVKLKSALGMLSKTLPWGFNKSIERGFMTRRSVQFMALLGLVLVVSACAVSADKEMNHDD